MSEEDRAIIEGLDLRRQAMTLTDFLLARIAEDEAGAIDADLPDWEVACRVGHDEMMTRPMSKRCARVLAECEAKRRIVRMDYLNMAVVKHLAAVYADHPDYRDEWRP